MDNEEVRRAEIGRERLKELMAEQELSQRALSAKIKELGLAFSDQRRTIGDILKGKRDRYFTVKSADIIAPALGVTPAYLLGSSDDRTGIGDQVQGESRTGRPKIFSDILPPEPDLIGRDDQIKAIKERLFAEDKRYRFALHGIPGVGKTALALKLVYDGDVREHFKDGILWAGLGRDGDVLAQLGGWAGKLGVSPEAMKGLTTVEKRGKEIRAVIGDRRVLLVVDDIWTDDAAAAFSIGGQNCVHIITARAPEVAFYFADEEGTIPVHTLSEEDGLALLEKLAPRAVKAKPEMAQELRELVKAVGGLPLALKLMGNYLKKEGRSSDRERIRRALNRLQSPEERLRLKEAQKPLEWHPSLPEEVYISLWLVIQISVEVLDEVVREALYAFSVFPSTASNFSEAAALAVTAASPEVIYKLVDVGLLETNEQGRYFLHQTITDYAREKRTDEAVFGRMVDFFVRYIGEHERDYEALNLEMSNILAALEAAEAHERQKAFVQGTNRLCHFLEVRALYDAAESLLARAQEMVKTADDAIGLVMVLLNRGSLAEKRANYPQAKIYLEEGLAKARELGLRERISKALSILGRVKMRTGELGQAEENLQEGLRIAEELGLREDVGECKIRLGALRYSQGESGAAELYLKEGLAIAQELGLRDKICGVMVNLSAIAIDQSDYSKAEQHCEEGLAMARRLGLHDITIMLLNNAALAASGRGMLDQARGCLEEGLALARKHELESSVIAITKTLGGEALNQSRYGEAEKYLEESLGLSRKSGAQQNTVAALRDLGELATKRRFYAKAAAYLQEGLATAQELDLSSNVMSSYFLSLGILALKQKGYEQADNHLQKALPLARESEHGGIISEVLTQLGESATAQGQFKQAQAYLDEARDILEPMEEPGWKALNLVAWGRLYLGQANLSLAAESFKKALEISRKAGIPEFVADALCGLAQVALAQGNIPEARRQGQESLAIFEGIGHGEAAEVREWLERLPA
jgi:tetratricopeptide (TPR) repeat protein/transcriptional regulator with XRE-family HTH domain